MCVRGWSLRQYKIDPGLMLLRSATAGESQGEHAERVFRQHAGGGSGATGREVDSAIRGAPHVARRHAAVPRALQLRVARNDWDRNDVHERVRA